MSLQHCNITTDHRLMIGLSAHQSVSYSIGLYHAKREYWGRYGVMRETQECGLMP